MFASRILCQIEELDPVVDHQKILPLHMNLDFPSDTNRALEFALFRTFAVPSISQLLDSTGEFHHRAQRRYDDTGLLLSEMMERGYESERGKRALRQMNKIHSRYSISNEDYLYVLSTFIYEPIRWNQKFGWRPMVEKEKLAMFYFWREIGGRMNIRQIPATYEEFERWSLDYEEEHFVYSPSNQRVAQATVNLFLSWFPAFLRSPIRRGIYCFLDFQVRKAFGFPNPPFHLEQLVKVAMKLRAVCIAWIPRRRKPFYFTEIRGGSYPNGYVIEELGPPGKGGK